MFPIISEVKFRLLPHIFTHFNSHINCGVPSLSTFRGTFIIDRVDFGELLSMKYQSCKENCCERIGTISSRLMTMHTLNCAATYKRRVSLRYYRHAHTHMHHCTHAPIYTMLLGSIAYNMRWWSGGFLLFVAETKVNCSQLIVKHDLKNYSNIILKSSRKTVKQFQYLALDGHEIGILFFV